MTRGWVISDGGTVSPGKPGSYLSDANTIVDTFNTTIMSYELEMMKSRLVCGMHPNDEVVVVHLFDFLCVFV